MAIAKDIYKNENMHIGLLEGVNKLADAVCATLGPGGQYVAIETASGVPHITKDGYTVARSILLEHPVENIGAEIVKQAAVKQNELSGDGTTTTTCLAQALYKRAVNLMYHETYQLHPTKIKKELEKLRDETIAKLQQQAKPVNPEDYFHIASVSSNGDTELATHVADAWTKVGRDGFVAAHSTKLPTTEVHVTTGYLADGYVPHVGFLTKQDAGIAEYENPLIVLIDADNLTLGQLSSALHHWEHEEGPLVLISNGLKDNILSTFYNNRMENGLRVLPIIADMDHETFDDLGIYLGCDVFTEQNLDFNAAAENNRLFGRCSRIYYKGRRVSLVGGAGEGTPELDQRVTLLRELKTRAVSQSPNEVEYTSKRLGRICGGVATIAVGGQTESEIKELKDRYDDAIHAVRSSFLMGVLPGAGEALRVISRESHNLFSPDLAAPGIRVFENAGYPVPVASGTPTNIRTGMKDVNIVDPAKVVIDAVKDAVSVAILLTMTSHTITFNDQALQEFKNQVVRGQHS